MIYLDASALVTLLSGRRPSERLRAFLAETPGTPIATSIIGFVETVRTLDRVGSYPTLMADLVRDVSEILVTEEIRDLAAALPGGCRTVDAIHVASAQALGESLTVLVSYDRRMLDVAHAVGITTAAPACRTSASKRLVPRLGSVRLMPIRLENVGIAVRDLDAAIAFFTDLGLTVLGRDTVSGEWTDTAVGLDGNHARIAMLQTPDGGGRLELVEYLHPEAIETEPTRPNEIGMHRVAFSVDDLDEALAVAARHGCHPLRGVATYEDLYRLTYVRGPSGILVMLAQELRTAG